MSTLGAESKVRDLVQDLGREVSGEVRFDKMTRLLYSTDASIYQIEPVGVVLPKNTDDVIAVIETANKYKFPILPRGGGTSLAGQTVGEAIVIDFSKYMRNILEINPEEGWVRTQPGIILDELNQHLKHENMFFAPDPSTSNRGNVGGALGNNSCGAHSIVWGKTSDNVKSVDVVLSNGDTSTFGPFTHDSIASTKEREREIYRSILAIGENNKTEILARYPKIQRRVSGYNLDDILDPNNLNMARFIVGSEGTLVTITEAKLRIVPRPKHKALSVLHFSSLIESMEATVATLEIGPSAVEHIGSMILRQARTNLGYARLMDFIEGDPESILVVELTGDTAEELLSKLDAFETKIKKLNLGYHISRLTKEEDQNKVWAVRKAGLGLMMNVPGDAKPLPFVEDTAVSPEKLPEFVKRFDEIVRSHGTEAGYYGHASVGCLHIRPLINLKVSSGIDKMMAIANEISDLTLEFEGSMSGEHGDGLVRSMWNEKMFGSTIYSAFKEVKSVFDPENMMNPGKIVDSQPMIENLRMGPNHQTTEINTGFSYTKEGGFSAAIEMCNGQGACRKVTGGTMCPSYMVTREEKHSTRGRANALRGAISGDITRDSLASEDLYEVLDLCLECKACKAECPSNVDMTKLKYDFMDKYYASKGNSLRNLIFGNIDKLSYWGSFFAPFSNWSIKSSILRTVMDEKLGIDKRRGLPTFESQSFTQWFKSRHNSKVTGKNGKVLLFPDTYTNYNFPNLGKAAVKLFDHLDYETILPKVKCCGRPMLSKGMISKAKQNARYNVEVLYPYVKQGAKLVGIEPSCILSFVDDYVDLLEGDPKAKLIQENTMLIEEFIMHSQENGLSLSLSNPPTNVLLHGHCHQKALVGTGIVMQLLASIPGCSANETDAGCCGMAGSFGFEKEHYNMSLSIGEHSLFPEIRDFSSGGTIISEGISCRQQIFEGTGRRAKHLVELLADAL